MAPLSDGDGKLMGYAYITARLTVAADSDKLVVTDKMPFIQDALVRDINAPLSPRQPIRRRWMWAVLKAASWPMPAASWVPAG